MKGASFPLAHHGYVRGKKLNMRVPRCFKTIPIINIQKTEDSISLFLLHIT